MKTMEGEIMNNCVLSHNSVTVLGPSLTYTLKVKQKCELTG